MPNAGTLRTRARDLRLHSTEAERVLWRRLSARKVAGVRFNRQVPIGPFICDFVARSMNLIVEIDGGQHAIEVEQDAQRTRFLAGQGSRVIRFWNNDVMERIEGVILAIERAIAARPSPDPSRKREGSR